MCVLGKRATLHTLDCSTVAVAGFRFPDNEAHLETVCPRRAQRTEFIVSRLLSAGCRLAFSASSPAHPSERQSAVRWMLRINDSCFRENITFHPRLPVQ